MASLSARQRGALMRNKPTEKTCGKGPTMIETIKLKLHSDRGDAPTGPSTPLLSALDGYTEDELSEYRQVFNMFDIDRSGAIALDELETAIRNLGLEQTRDELDKIIDESESNVISKKDFQYILRELGDITDNQIIDEIFLEADVDGNGLIDYDEFSYMVKNYLTDEDIN
uniref:Putative calmodulin isoform c n=1 Tax=Dictyocaulus viviparus TaxID=29172 RepID=Q6QGY8_DICVI|nr:putative calmodulin isoform c [Dictyocaulus viviparus]